MRAGKKKKKKKKSPRGKRARFPHQTKFFSRLRWEEHTTELVERHKWNGSETTRAPQLRLHSTHALISSRPTAQLLCRAVTWTPTEFCRPNSGANLKPKNLCSYNSTVLLSTVVPEPPLIEHISTMSSYALSNNHKDVSNSDEELSVHKRHTTAESPRNRTGVMCNLLMTP